MPIMPPPLWRSTIPCQIASGSAVSIHALWLAGWPMRGRGGCNEQFWSSITHAFQARALWSLLESDTPPLLFYLKAVANAAEKALCLLKKTWRCCLPRWCSACCSQGGV